MKACYRFGHVGCFIVLLFFCVRSISAQTYTLSGRVYSGSVGQTSNPISGVTMKLWGANDAGSGSLPPGSYVITSTSTDGNGWYGLNVDVSEDACDVYIIEEIDPSGYYSVDATSVSGTKLSSNLIQYMFVDLTDGTRTGNKFWDKPYEPEMDVTGNGISISDGDNTPSSTDGTDFGSVAVSGGTKDQVFTIKNTGSAILRIYKGVTISGSDFVASWPDSGIAAGASSTFTVRFDPISSGTRSATISISNNDSNENPYNFTIQGTGTAPTTAPEMDVTGNGISISDGDNTPSSTDGTDFGSVAVSGGTKDQVFTIKNTGSAILRIYKGVTISGSDFVASWPDSGIAAGASSTFTVRFDPISSGTRSATISISNNDSDENPYNFAIQGTGTTPSTAPEIDVKGNGVSISDGDNTPSVLDGTDFGFISIGDSSYQRFSLYNTGTSNLFLTGKPDKVVIGGIHAGDFSVSRQPDSLLSSGIDSTWFSIKFRPSASGTRTATITIPNNDADENPYNFTIQGNFTGGGGTGTIIVEKQTIPDGDTQLFTFYGHLSGSLSDGAQFSSSQLAPGKYWVYEQVPQGWTLTDIDITETTNNSIIDLDSTYAELHLDSSETITVVFTNTKDSVGQEYDFGDAPDPTYPTLRANNGARHLIDPHLYLGFTVDGEPDGVTSILADGDDQNGSNDEDGITMSPFIAPGQTVSVTIMASDTGWVNGWLDFNINGNWADPGEHIIVSQQVYAGVNGFSFTVPATAISGLSFARFRLSSVSELSYIGEAPDGEVEDYPVEIKEAEGGSVTIVKEANPSDDTPFLFCIQQSSGFFNILCTNLQDPSDNQWILLNPGNLQSVYESLTPGWTLTDIQITGDTDNGSVIHVSSQSVDLDFDPGEDIVITFENEKEGGGGDASVGDWVWHDLNQNGLQDAGEPGLANVVVSLFDDNGNLLATTQTNPSGQYLFSNLTPGSYFVRFSLKVGFTFSPPDQGTDDAIDSDVQFGLGDTPVFALSAGDYNTDMDAGMYETGDTGQIRGSKWNDINGNGIQEPGEPGMANWQIILDYNQDGVLDPFSSQDVIAVTNAFGEYDFTGHLTGMYLVGEILRSGWQQTFPDTTHGSHLGNVAQFDHSIILSSGQVVSDIDFGNVYRGEEGERDYGDAPFGFPSASHLLGGPHIGFSPTNGVPDADPGMQNDPHAEGDDMDGSDDEEGFEFVPTIWSPGYMDAKLICYVPAGYLWVTVGVWIDFTQDGDWDDAGEEVFNLPLAGTPFSLNWPIDMSSIPNLVTGSTIARVRIVEGNYPTLSYSGDLGKGEVEDYEIEIPEPDTPGELTGVIYGAKWNDTDGNGIWDPGENALPGWIMYLDMNNNDVNDAGEPSAVTDSKGQFSFTGLTADTYTVREEIPSGWIQTFPGGTGEHSIVVDPTKPSMGILFGNREDDTSDLGAIKWFQAPLTHYVEDQDTICFQGWQQMSVSLMPVVADDWFCYNPQPVTLIRWWGAYTDWDTTVIPPNAPNEFHIGVWSDVPSGMDREWSHPGHLIHEWIVDRTGLGERPVRGVYFPELPESNLITGFEYTFEIPMADWFHQDGDSSVYWLSITALYDEEPEENVWGWLTREHYFHDDAINLDFSIMPQPGSEYENGDPIAPRWDMAFILGTEEYEQSFDFGDAPQTGYATLLVNNGAHHRVLSEIRMGDAIDNEEDGLPDSGALGDDQTETDDEDGVEFTETLFAGEGNEIVVHVSSSGFLNGWLDVHGNGNWYEPEDHVLEEIELGAGEHVLGFFVPEDAVMGETAFRFRFSREPHLWFNGFAMDGEVEDYMITIGEITSVETQDDLSPKMYKIYANYPNPFNPTTHILFDLPRSEEVSLTVYNIRGVKIRTLVEDFREAGSYQVIWNATDENGNTVPTGLYLCRIITAHYQETIRMILLK